MKELMKDKLIRILVFSSLIFMCGALFGVSIERGYGANTIILPATPQWYVWPPEQGHPAGKYITTKA